MITRNVTNTSRELPAPTGNEAARDERPSTGFICVCGRSFQTVRGRNIHRGKMKCSLEVENSAGSGSVNANTTQLIEGSQEMLLNSVNELPAVTNPHTAAPEVTNNSTIVNSASDGPSDINLTDTNPVPIAEPTLNINNNNMRAKIKACGNNCYTCPILNISNIFTSTLK